MVIICCHWTACLWGGVGVQMRFADQTNWIEALREQKGGKDELYNSVGGIYSLALYWALMTTTTIGYGDITPQCLEEYIAGMLCMFGAALTWAVVLGEMCTILGNLSPHELQFKRTMDDLNWMLEDHNVPHAMRLSLRSYLNFGRTVKRHKHQLSIVDQLSPMLQGDLSMHIHSHWLDKVKYLKGLHIDTVVGLATKLHIGVMAPSETLPGHQRKLYIIRKGVCAHGPVIKSVGGMWGEDMVLNNRHLRRNRLTRAMSFVEVLSLDYQDLLHSLDSSHHRDDALNKIRWARLSYALRRGLMKMAKLIRAWCSRTDSIKVPEDIRSYLIEQAPLQSDAQVLESLKGRRPSISTGSSEGSSIQPVTAFSASSGQGLTRDYLDSRLAQLETKVASIVRAEMLRDQDGRK
eukprot:CAMPEP_0115132214 /NCGR_PEP_ID=MMETSP0227-20121206/53602_1 /TAXON_ID=89957 /ORGANISM="Polarella glacialis, Strain CCMP 1383" /LENGTH=405 /DNA_ID=CAMNT_0002537929 /DNA_START=269 /DNA_END=1487 /DNA_ORIENTATION=+